MMWHTKFPTGFSLFFFRNLPLYREESCVIMTVTDEIWVKEETLWNP